MHAKRCSLFLIGVLLGQSACVSPNHAPEIQFLETNPPFGEAPVQGWLLWKISDPDGDTLTCEVDVNGDGIPEQTITPCTNDDAAQFQLDAPGRHRITLTVSDGRKRVHREVSVYSNHCPLRPYVKHPEQVPGFDHVVLSEGHMELLFRDPSQVGQGAPFEIQEGDILVGTRKGGYGRIVRGVLPSLSSAGRRYQITTEQATLPDLVEDCYYGVRDVTWPMTKVDCEEGCENVESIEHHTPDEPTVKGGPSVSATFGFVPLPLPNDGSIKSSLTFKLELKELVVDYSLAGGLKEFRMVIHPSVGTQTKLSLPMGGLSFEPEKTLGSFTLSAVTLGPVVVVPRLDIKLEGSLDLSPTVYITGKASAGADVGFSYRKDEGTDGWVDPEVSGSFLNPEVELGIGSAKVGLTAKVGFWIYGVVGPYAKRGPFVKGKLTLNDSDEVCLEGSVGADTTYGVAFDFFGLEDPDLNWDMVKTGAYWTFYSRCFSAPCSGAGCPSECGDGLVEGSETCDPPESCPTVCPDDGDPCTVDSLAGSAADCTAECVHAPVESCADGDGCCPPACDESSDSDCDTSLCDNGQVDPGEECDPISSCPTSCPPQDACHPRHLEGAPETCTARCVDDPEVTECQDGDGCCPSGCGVFDDSDCQAICSNGVCETPMESHDTCPADCPAPDPCQAVSGGTYCGATPQFPGGDPGTLYACSGGTTTTSEVCVAGCHVAPPGEADFCETPTLGEYGDSCTASTECGASAPYCSQQGFCCVEAGGLEPDATCGSGADCCSGHCVSGHCCWNTDPPGCIL